MKIFLGASAAVVAAGSVMGLTNRDNRAHALADWLMLFASLAGMAFAVLM